MNAKQQQMCAMLMRLAPNEGYTASRLENVRFMRADRPLPRTPVLYEPGIIIVCQGRKRGYLADRVYLYDAQHYLVLPVPLPFYSETDASPEAPMLAIAVRLDLAQIAELNMLMQGAAPPALAEPAGIISTPIDETLCDVVLRLLEALSSPLEASVLGPACVRELCFRVMQGERGGAVLSALAWQGHFGRISQALNHIHSEWQSPLNVPLLAEKAGMSVPRFHLHFKSVTHTSPIQYLKSLRLHQARLMMIQSQMSAASTAFAVGYESPSQFNREFKRFFGRSPGEEARQMKQAMASYPAEEIHGRLLPH